MKRIAVFPGSFDPVTKGHESIIIRAIPLFDEIIVAIGKNVGKQHLFALEQRIKWLEHTFNKYPKIKIESYSCLTIDFCHQKNAKYILRGLRTSADFEFERSIGQVNKSLSPEVETVFLLTDPEYSALTSSIVREIYSYGGDVSKYIPTGIQLS